MSTALAHLQPSTSATTSIQKQPYEPSSSSIKQTNGATAIDGETCKGDIVQTAAEEEPEPEVDIVINNVVCSFNVRCHLNLREIALRGLNVEYRKENGVSFPPSTPVTSFKRQTYF